MSTDTIDLAPSPHPRSIEAPALRRLFERLRRPTRRTWQEVAAATYGATTGAWRLYDVSGAA
jgi:hypothetical protein